jgi:hypothetical protein
MGAPIVTRASYIRRSVYVAGVSDPGLPAGWQTEAYPTFGLRLREQEDKPVPDVIRMLTHDLAGTLEGGAQTRGCRIRVRIEIQPEVSG